MGWLRSALCVTLCCLVPHGGAQDAEELIAHHSFKGPFFQEWWTGGVKFWEPAGSTVVGDDYVRLTGAMPDKTGVFVNKEPVTMEAWELTMKVRIHSRQTPGADGMALWLTEMPANEITNYNAAMTEWDQGNDLRGQTEFSCVVEYRNQDESDLTAVRLSYRNRKLEVYIQVGSARENYCGTAKRVELPPVYYFSLAAKTGRAFDHHDVHSFQVTASQAARQHVTPTSSTLHTYNPHQAQAEMAKEYPPEENNGRRSSPPSEAQLQQQQQQYQQQLQEARRKRAQQQQHHPEDFGDEHPEDIDHPADEHLEDEHHLFEDEV